MLTLFFALLFTEIIAENPMIQPSPTQKPHYVHYQRGRTEDAHPKTEGGFVLMGGGKDVDEAFEWMAERGGHGDFLVLRGSGSDGYQEYIDELTDVNSVETLLLNDAEAASDPFVVERVQRAEAIFLAGGDQWNYVGKWKDSPLLDAINQAIAKGVPIGGTSAGLAVLGEHVFTAEKDTVTPEEALANPYHENITLSSDFFKSEPLANLITDSHFSQRERMGRLTTFMARLQQDGSKDSVRGVGVDENTAALVSPDGHVEVVGSGGAHFVKSEKSPEVCRDGEPLTYRGLEVRSLHRGDSMELSDWSSKNVEAKALNVENGILIP